MGRVRNDPAFFVFISNTKVLNDFKYHCEPEERGNLTPSLPSPLKGEGEGGGDCVVAVLLPKDKLLFAFVLVGSGIWDKMKGDSSLTVFVLRPHNSFHGKKRIFIIAGMKICVSC